MSTGAFFILAISACAFAQTTLSDLGFSQSRMVGATAIQNNRPVMVEGVTSNVVPADGTNAVAGISAGDYAPGTTAQVVMTGTHYCAFDNQPVANEIVTAVNGLCHSAGVKSRQLLPHATPIVGAVVSVKGTQFANVIVFFPGASGLQYDWDSIMNKPTIPSSNDISNQIAASVPTLASLGGLTQAQTQAIINASLPTASALGVPTNAQMAAAIAAAQPSLPTLASLGGVTSAQAAAAAPVQSVNGGTGAVAITLAGLGGVTTAQASAAAPVQSVDGLTGAVTSKGAKVYTSTGQIAAPKVWFGAVASDTSGNFTASIATAAFSAAPVCQAQAVAASASAANQINATILPPTATTINGFLTKPTTISVLGALTVAMLTTSTTVQITCLGQ